MSLLQNSNAISTGGGYNLESSLRFRGGQNLTRTITSASNRRTYTQSVWLKRTAIGTSPYIFNQYVDGNTNSLWYFNASSTEAFNVFNRIGGTNYQVQTSASFRDTSAWYHIVVATDTTQATASNRVKIWINGEQVTSFSATGYPPQNSDTAINTATTYYIGSSYASSQYFDGYMTEYNFVDGQALTANDFGEYDNTTGVWKPKQYTGTYGTNGFYLPFTEAQASGFTDHFTDLTGGQNVQVVDNSLIEPGSSEFCIEFWCRPDTLNGVQENYICKGSSGYAAYIIGLYSGTPGDGTLTMYGSSSGSSWNVFNGEVFGTVSAGSWHHLAFYRIGNNFYGAVNGNVRFIKTYAGAIWNNGNNLFIGTDGGGGSQSDIDVSNFRMVIGSSVYGTSNFTPPTAPLTAITGTRLLTLQDSTFIDNSGNGLSITTNGSPTLTSGTVGNYVTIGDDDSGNGNNLNANNMNVTTSTATTYDVMNDVPTLTNEDTANFCTLNPLDRDDLDLPTSYITNGNLEVDYTNAAFINANVYGSIYVPKTGKWYVEARLDAYYGSNSLRFGFNAGAAYLQVSAVGDYAIAVDWDNELFWTRTNGTWTGNPEAGTGGTSCANSQTLIPFFVRDNSGSTGNGGKWIVNFGQRPFKYSQPTGFKKINTYNLPDSTIKDGSQYMKPVVYTGNGTSQDITVGFEPEAFWVKNRTNAYNHAWSNFVTNTYLYPNLTNSEGTTGSSINQLSDGFNLNTSSNVFNASGNSYVAWNWRGSDSSPVSNTDGTITSTVSVNTTAKFSIATYTGTGANATVGHSLGVTPAMVIVKRRDSAGNWNVRHVSIPAANSLYLNLTNASQSDPTVWNSTSPNSTVFSIGTDTGVNASGGTYVAYCWAEVAGFSKFGSYTGNGSTDGPFVHTGFRPAFVMTKRTDVGAPWYIWDSSRNTYNITNLHLYPNYNNAEVTENNIDLVSNGFKWRNSISDGNASGGTFIYMAFAENPFKNALAR